MKQPIIAHPTYDRGLGLPARHTSQKFPQTREIIDFGNISQPGENLVRGIYPTSFFPNNTLKINGFPRFKRTPHEPAVLY